MDSFEKGSESHAPHNTPAHVSEDEQEKSTEIKQLSEQLAEKDAQMEQMKADFAAKLADKDAEIADKQRQYTEMRPDFEAARAADEKRSAELKAKLEAAHAAEKAALEAEIAELKANAKTAEQIAAEKYSAGIAPLAGGLPGGQSLKERIETAREQGPEAFRRFVKANRAEIRGL